MSYSYSPEDNIQSLGLLGQQDNLWWHYNDLQFVLLLVIDSLRRVDYLNEMAPWGDNQRALELDHKWHWICSQSHSKFESCFWMNPKTDEKIIICYIIQKVMLKWITFNLTLVKINILQFKRCFSVVLFKKKNQHLKFNIWCWILVQRVYACDKCQAKRRQ